MNNFWIVLGVMAIAAGIFAPLRLLSPQAKRIYLPLALGVIAIGLQGLFFYAIGTGFIFAIFFCAGVVSYIYIVLHMQVCLICGHVEGLTTEAHQCTSPSTHPLREQSVPHENQEAHFSWLISQCEKESSLHFEPLTGILSVAREGVKNKRFAGLFCLLFSVALSYHSITHDYQYWGYGLVLILGAIFLLSHSVEVEINVHERTIARTHRCFGKLAVWRRVYSVVDGDKLRIHATVFQPKEGHAPEYFHDIVCEKDGRKQISIGRYSEKTSSDSAAALHAIETIAGALRLEYEGY